MRFFPNFRAFNRPRCFDAYKIIWLKAFVILLAKNWLYNFASVKDKPADLAHYLGYKIAEEYFKNVLDKNQAIIDVIKMNDPTLFLQKNKYDQKVKE
jgi:hypothetical protein